MLDLLTQLAPPELRTEDLQAKVDRLHEREREARQALGLALMLGRKGEAARAELRRVREDLDGFYSAMRLLEVEGTRCSTP